MMVSSGALLLCCATLFAVHVAADDPPCEFDGETCEWKRAKFAWADCPQGFVRTARAFWGRDPDDNTTCVDRVPFQYLQNLNCTGNDEFASIAVNDWCSSNLRSDKKCKIRASVRKLMVNGQRYDPCPGTFKYMRVCTYCKDDDDCANSPCQNGGACTDGVNSHTCDCVDGYSGDNCETDDDDCANSPCLNRGSCTDGVNSYSCVCATGYSGDNCEADTRCQPNPCRNGGTCYTWGFSFRCSCRSGYYSGSTCQIRNGCQPSPCINGGTCYSWGSSSFHCSCGSGYIGTTCQTRHTCQTNPCRNGATCRTWGASFRCLCRSGYTGSTCQYRNGCQPNPCRNGGTCHTWTDSFSCLCRSGYTGTTCQTRNMMCQPNPCSNGGTCHTWGRDSFRCSCSSEYRGCTCQTLLADFDDCAAQLSTCVLDMCFINQPCFNGGKCIDGIDSYTCECADGYYGTHCYSNKDWCALQLCQNNATLR